MKTRTKLRLISLVMLIVAVVFVFCALVHTYHKPIFCIGVYLADDGGSGG